MGHDYALPLLGRSEEIGVAESPEASLERGLLALPRGLGRVCLFDVASDPSRSAVPVTAASPQDFDAITRAYVASGQEHQGLVIVHPGRFPS